MSQRQGLSRTGCKQAAGENGLQALLPGRGHLGTWTFPSRVPTPRQGPGRLGVRLQPPSRLPGEKSASTASWLLVLGTHFSEDQQSLRTPAHSCPSHTHTLLCTLTHMHALALSCAHSHALTHALPLTRAHSHTLTPHHPPHPLSRRNQKLLYKPLSSPRRVKLCSSSQGPPGLEGC